MKDLQPARGTHDLLPEDARAHQAIGSTFFEMAHRYGFGPIATPIFEPTQVFARTLGEASDIVSKEMYTFTDRGGDSLTLRPENTAGVVRAVLSNGLLHQLPLKLAYHGPMFRYERPQKGRQRQFHQIGVETLGVEGSHADVETIALGYELLKKWGMAEVCQLQINTLGDMASRSSYREALVAHLNRFKKDLSPDSQVRLEKNPLRILDSKSETDRKILEGAPSLAEHLTTEAANFFAQILNSLEKLEIPHVIHRGLVRGLDYYTHTVFEFTTRNLGAQDAVLAGGRYDGLVEQMGGPSTPGVGWAAGVERLVLLRETLHLPSPAGPGTVVVLPVEDEQIPAALLIAAELRKSWSGHTELLVGGQLGRRMKKATQRYCARYAVIVGADEVAEESITVKDFDSGDQRKVSFEQWLLDLQATYHGFSEAP